jgi:hypothetical protein
MQNGGLNFFRKSKELTGSFERRADISKSALYQVEGSRSIARMEAPLVGVFKKMPL